MALAPGTKLGPYHVLGPLGSGGMGEVYRARDARLERDVAVKVLPADLTSDPDRLRRFEQEAKAAGLLNHPNLTAVYDIGTHEGAPYVVQELLEGETLRSRLGGAAMPARRAIDQGLQIARGLAAAHEKGIVHRDLKPDNIFITTDGRVKILDFGLARVARAEGAAELTSAPTEVPGTMPGVILGTLGYMSPEQVRGRPADHRSDIFSFGVVLYEMLTARRAFQGETAADTMTAILKEEPPDVSAINGAVPPGLERLVHHCMEKSPEQRFQSAKDLAYDLESLSGASGSGSQAARAAAGSAARIPKWASTLALTMAFLVAGAALGWIAGSRVPVHEPPAWHRLTFRRGTVWTARFAPDGKTIVYGAAFEGRPVEMFMTRPESPESRPLGFPQTDILSISPTGELAIMLGAQARGTSGYGREGALARMPLVGGSPRKILEDVRYADWSSDGKDLAVMRYTGGGIRLEYPIGKILLESPGLRNPRVSPDGTMVAFFDGAGGPDVSISVLDKSGRPRALTSGLKDWWFLTWSPDGKEVWFAAPEAGQSSNTSAVFAVNLSGRVRLLARVPGALELHDTSREGRALVGRVNYRGVVRGRTPGEAGDRDLSWLDSTSVSDISNDGTTLLLVESGEGGGASSSIYLRKTDGSPATLIGEGRASALSPDGKWLFGEQYIGSKPRNVILPVGPGSPILLKTEGFSIVDSGSWFPDGRRIVISASEPGHTDRLYELPIDGGAPRPISPEGYAMPWFSHSVSPDGRIIAGVDPNGSACLIPMDGSAPKQVPGSEAGEMPLRWTADGRSLYMMHGGEVPAKVWRIDVATGRRELITELSPADPAGVTIIETAVITPDGKSYAFSYHNNLSDLYLVDGLK